MAEEPAAPEPQGQPTPPEPATQPSDAEIINDVTEAGRGAVSRGENPMAAMQEALAKFKLSDDDVGRISNRLIEDLRGAGAFDPPPEPIAAPTQPTAPPAPPAQPQEPTAPAAPEPRKNFAQRFMGI